MVPHWIVLEPSGERVLGRVELPGDRRLFHADSEGVLVVVVDESEANLEAKRRFESERLERWLGASPPT